MEEVLQLQAHEVERDDQRCVEGSLSSVNPACQP